MFILDVDNIQEPTNTAVSLYGEVNDPKALMNGIVEDFNKVKNAILSKGAATTKQYPNPNQYIEPEHSGNAGGEYITPDSNLYVKRVYN